MIIKTIFIVGIYVSLLLFLTGCVVYDNGDQPSGYYQYPTPLFYVPPHPQPYYYYPYRGIYRR
jgi:hypothetical protein